MPLSSRKLQLSYQSLTKWLWLLLLYTFFIILWGAFVRASGSGAGCGEHWPLCNGQVIPRSPSVETIIEFTHRLTSGLYGIFIIILAIWSFLRFPKGHLCRKAALATGFFTLTEALIGARIVLFGLVGENSSVERAVVIAFHLMNTIFLIASLVFWIHSSSSTHLLRKRFLAKSIWSGFFLCTVLFILTGMSGAITALGDTLFPSTSLIEGIQADFNHDSHFLVRLRIFHPFVATTLVAVIFVFAKIYTTYIRVILGSSFLPNLLIVLSFSGLALGVINLLLMAPIWMQLVHLLWANMIWTTLMILFTRLRYTH